MNDLTIVIPTYNRPDKLKNTLSTLSSWKSKSIVISVDVVVNYHSDLDSEKYMEVFTSVCKNNLDLNLNYVFNKFNIGGAANVLRAIEHSSEAEWIWLLSDDDEIEPNFEDVVSKKLNSIGSAVGCVKFDSNLYGEITNDTLIKNVNDVFDNEFMCHEYFSNLLFLSNYLFRMDSISSLLNSAYRYVGSFGPQLFLMLLVIENEHELLLSSDVIVKSKINEEGGWDGTIVHNNLFEHFRVSDIGFSNNVILKIRKSLFNESLGKGILGRYLRAKDKYDKNVLERLLFGKGNYGSIIEFLLIFSSKLLNCLGGRISYKKENGTKSRF